MEIGNNLDVLMPAILGLGQEMHTLGILRAFGGMTEGLRNLDVILASKMGPEGEG